MNILLIFFAQNILCSTEQSNQALQDDTSSKPSRKKCFHMIFTNRYKDLLEDTPLAIPFLKIFFDTNLGNIKTVFNVCSERTIESYKSRVYGSYLRDEMNKLFKDQLKKVNFSDSLYLTELDDIIPEVENIKTRDGKKQIEIIIGSINNRKFIKFLWSKVFVLLRVGFLFLLKEPLSFLVYDFERNLCILNAEIRTNDFYKNIESLYTGYKWVLPEYYDVKYSSTDQKLKGPFFRTNLDKKKTFSCTTYQNAVIDRIFKEFLVENKLEGEISQEKEDTGYVDTRIKENIIYCFTFIFESFSTKYAANAKFIIKHDFI
ncbi:hypothetical protein CWI36_0119p0010 [Hamiltosporidium magnivora]|uniref:Uncharacterized protein n=2 Tax=Hamiltosporidium TaxID=1176354 RepID=A0A4V2JWM3_9MICR|nr:hypothetical protein CWI36_0122p0010 [Hamiltosporidium magnivora]TBU08587.1 hypothetical protein CWI36_0119p0010 [Hamiltosporidium magnivora]